MISAVIGFSTSSAQAEAPQSVPPTTTIIYFVRHGEDVPELVNSDPSFTVAFNNCNFDGSCCVEALNPLGKVRASALADWFEAKGITRTLTHVIASHKLRTRQTVAKIANLADLGGDLDGNGTLDGLDVDQAPGDGVINVPPTPAECDEGWTSSRSVIEPQTNYINSLPLGSRGVLCSHSPALYPIMRAFGIDTTDSVRFPKDSSGRVTGFNNLWTVELKPVTVGEVITYQGRLLSHILLDIDVGVSLIERDYGLGAEKGSKSDSE
jgi:hypothetical protein